MITAEQIAEHRALLTRIITHGKRFTVGDAKVALALLDEYATANATIEAQRKDLWLMRARLNKVEDKLEDAREDVDRLDDRALLLEVAEAAHPFFYEAYYSDHDHAVHERLDNALEALAKARTAKP